MPTREEGRPSAKLGLGFVGLVLVTGCLGLRLGAAPLIDPDEGRTAAVALAMADSGDYVVPHLNGLPHLDKPSLFYAAGALSMQAFGASEAAARFPALLAAWATVALTAWFAAHLFGRTAAWIAGTACAAAPLTLAMARTVIFDSLLGFFVVLALVAFYRAIEGRGDGENRQRLGWTVLAWCAIAGGILTKGPIALLLPLLVAGPYALWRRRQLAVWHPFGVAALLLLVAPWLIAVEQRIPGFLRYALVTETWNRLTTDELKRSGPFWYFLPYLLGGCFPWILVAASRAAEGWRQLRRGEDRHRLVYLALWIGLPLLFFSLSKSKRPQYILPLIPAVALVAAWACTGDRFRPRNLRIGAGGWAILGSLFAILGAGAGRWADKLGELAQQARHTALLLGLLMLGSAALAWIFAHRRELSIPALALPVALFPLATAALWSDFADERSARHLAAALRPHLAAGARIVGIETFPASLTFYLRQPIELSSLDAEPLRSNYISQSYAALATRASTLHPPDWWHPELDRCSRPLIFVIREHHGGAQAVLEAAGLPILFESDKLRALGPCRPREGG